MKRFDENLEVCVFKYDLREPLDWGPDIDEELKKQVELWNQLCMIEREHIAAVRAVAEPNATADAEAKPLVETFDRLMDERRAKRKAAKKKIPTPELDEQINDLHGRIKELRALAKQQRTAAYAENKDKLKELDKERYARVTEARQAAQAGGKSERSLVERIIMLKNERKALVAELAEITRGIKQSSAIPST